MNARRDGSLNSAAFLRRQQAEARAALQTTVSELKRDLRNVVDPQTWVQIAPWATLGVAAASGFAAAAVVVPGRHSSAPAASIEPNAIPAAPSSGKASGAIWAAVSTGLYGLGRLALTEVISSAMRMDPVRESAETADETADVDSDVFV